MKETKRKKEIERMIGRETERGMESERERERERERAGGRDESVTGEE